MTRAVERTRIESIVIVGGGTAGWLSAAYLERALPDVRITLIESSNVPTVGVGEATIPTLQWTLGFLGLREKDWMPRCNASYKTSIRFDNWCDDPDTQGPSAYWHPFSPRPEPVVAPYEAPFFPEFGRGFSLLHFWQQQRLLGKEWGPLAYACFEGPTLCDQRRAPRRLDGSDPGVISAYHLDAGLLAGLLRELAKERGVHHVVGHVGDIAQDEQGYITHLTTTDGQTLEADFFIDCSGFRGLLINGTMGGEFLNDNASLFVDSAVAIQCRNNPQQDGIKPYTTSTALKSGWVWDVPLYHRNGCGYVYSSPFVTSEQAEAEARVFLGPRAEGMPARHLKMRIGRNREVWIKNCLAIGLSSCFLEPLESTGIYLTELQLANLVAFFPDRHFHSSQLRAYNELIAASYEELRDFIVLHYVLTQREDSEFWRAVRHETLVPSTLTEKLELFEQFLPLFSFLTFRLFRERSYSCILAGMKALPRGNYPIVGQLDPAVGVRALSAMAKRIEELGATLPDHYAFLTRLYGDELDSPYEA